MEVTTISMSKSATEVVYMETHQTQKRQIIYTDVKTPAPEFQVAYGQLIDVVNDILPGVLQSPLMTKVSISRVNFKRSAAGAIGVIVSLCCEIIDSNRPWNFNTPLKFCLVAGQDATDACLSGKSADIIAELLNRARDFTQGIVAQAELDFTEPEPEIEAPQKLSYEELKVELDGEDQ